MLIEHLEKYKELVSGSDGAKSFQRGKPNCPLTEIRQETAAFLKKPFEMVCGRTSGWSAEQLRDLLRDAGEGKVPVALWWYLYKKRNLIYGKKYRKEKTPNKRGLRSMGKASRKEEQAKRQGVLF